MPGIWPWKKGGHSDESPRGDDINRQQQEQQQQQQQQDDDQENEVSEQQPDERTRLLQPPHYLSPDDHAVCFPVIDGGLVFDHLHPGLAV